MIVIVSLISAKAFSTLSRPVARASFGSADGMSQTLLGTPPTLSNRFNTTSSDKTLVADEVCCGCPIAGVTSSASPVVVAVQL